MTRMTTTYASIVALEAAAKKLGLAEIRWATKWSKTAHRYVDHAWSVGRSEPHRVDAGVFPECKHCDNRWRAAQSAH